MITEGRMLGAARARKCPACGAPDLLPGPRGGASQNFYCQHCREGWNLHGIDYGVIGIEPIGKIDPALIEFYLGAAAGEEIRRDQLKADGLTDAEIEEQLAITRNKLPRPDRVRMLRETLRGDGFTEQEIDEVFAFAQIVEPSGNVVRMREASVTEVRGIMHRLFRGKRDES